MRSRRIRKWTAPSDPKKKLASWLMVDVYVFDVVFSKAPVDIYRGILTDNLRMPSR